MATASFIIRNAVIHDGNGNAAITGDVAVSGEEVAAIGNLSGWQSELDIDARGRSLVPGFIDAGSHEDGLAPMVQLLAQGVTTIINGNSGQAPWLPDFGAYRDRLVQSGMALNVMAQVGYNALRHKMTDGASGPLSDATMAKVQASLATALNEGAAGLSCDLSSAGSGIRTDELVQLGACLHDAGGFISLSLRHTASEFLSALDEVGRICERAGVPVIIAHLRLDGGSRHRIHDVMAKIDALARQQSVGFTLSPYPASLDELTPERARDARNVLIAWSAGEPAMAGRALAVIAGEWRLGLEETIHRLMPAYALFFDGKDEVLAHCLMHPRAMVATETLPGLVRPHPSGHGAFARTVKGGGYGLPFPALVHRLSGLVAETYGLAGRGTIAEGAKADLALMNPSDVHDEANFEQPERLARGVDAVWVNGTLAFNRGRATGLKGGQFIRPLRRHPRQTDPDR